MYNGTFCKLGSFRENLFSRIASTDMLKFATIGHDSPTSVND